MDLLYNKLQTNPQVDL